MTPAVRRRSASWGSLLFLVKMILIALAVAPAVHGQTFVRAQAVQSEGIYGILRRHQLPTNAQYINKFREINTALLGGSSALKLGVRYQLPIVVFPYDGVSIRTTIGADDRQLAEKIEQYNRSVVSAGLKSAHYESDNQLWAPFFDIHQPASPTKPQPQPQPPAPPSAAKTNNSHLYGAAYRSTPIIDRALEGHCFYLVSGHGGPDPGAVGQRDGVMLYEDEYAYDITVRLARALEQRSATVYMIVQDANDGIRDRAILKGDHDERHLGGGRISSKTVARLQKRADIINELYQQNRTRAKSQYAVEIHVDSRSNSQRIDMFYYYQRDSDKSRRLALALRKTVKEKYEKHQPARGYSGTVSARNLFMLKHVVPPMVYIEVANIRNRRDQDRLLIVNNRQAVANWLCEGIVEFLK